jgi:hypothetical protein
LYSYIKLLLILHRINLRYAYNWTSESDEMSNFKLNKLLYWVNSNFSKIKGLKCYISVNIFFLQKEAVYWVKPYVKGTDSMAHCDWRLLSHAARRAAYIYIYIYIYIYTGDSWHSMRLFLRHIGVYVCLGRFIVRAWRRVSLLFFDWPSLHLLTQFVKTRPGWTIQTHTKR